MVPHLTYKEPSNLTSNHPHSTVTLKHHHSQYFIMRLTLLPLIFSLCASLAYAAALSPATLSSLAARTPDIEEPAVYSDVVAYALPDGHRKIDFYLDGALAGSVVETDDGGTFTHALTSHVDTTGRLIVH
jgi:hypothetical protein